MYSWIHQMSNRSLKSKKKSWLQNKMSACENFINFLEKKYIFGFQKFSVFYLSVVSLYRYISSVQMTFVIICTPKDIINLY